jgi:general secretion pathway protein D
MKERARLEELGPPKLDPRSNIPILLNFRDVEVGKIFEAISKASQVNFIFDEKVDLEKPMIIDIGNVTLEKAMDILMLQTKNFYKVIDQHTILIAPDTRPMRQTYDDQVIKTFFLSNGDTKTVVQLLRSLLQSRQIAENADLNSVTIKDTPDIVAIAERIISANDKSKGEVLVDVELLEINRNTAQNLGIDLSSKSLTLAFQGGDARVPLNNVDILNQQGNWSIGVIPSVTLNFLKSDSETRSIAKPQLRVTEGEKAEILIGDRVPIPTTSFNTSQTVGGNIVPITSFTYQNVGITVNIEPRVHHNQEITLKVSVEISQVTGSVANEGGASQPIIGTRQIQTVIRLRDGETNVLAGLIKEEDADEVTGIPGVMDLPGLNKVLSNNNRSRSQTDIILTLTPQIVRMPDIREEDLVTLWVGTQENVRLRGPETGAFGVTAFGDGTGGGGDLSAAGDGPRGGSVSRTAGSEEAERDLAEREREASEEDADRRRRSGPDRDRDTGERGADDADGSSREDDLDDTPEQPTGPAIVRLVPSAATVSVGDTLVVQVVLDNGTNVGSTPFHLRFNRQVLEFIEPAIQGDLLDRDGANAVFLANEAGAGGDIVVGYSRMGGETGITGSGLLATFQFRAINPGDVGFQFTGASVKDPQARNVPASFLSAGVTVVE